MCNNYIDIQICRTPTAFLRQSPASVDPRFGAETRVPVHVECDTGKGKVKGKGKGKDKGKGKGKNKGDEQGGENRPPKAKTASQEAKQVTRPLDRSLSLFTLPVYV